MIETAERDLWYSIIENGTYFIDIGQSLSLLNRRFYRQGMQYAVAGLEMHSDNAIQNAVYRLPQTWVVASAWEKCMRAWKEQQDEALEEADRESLVAQYRDFKIYMNETHVISGGGVNNLLPLETTDLTALPADVNYDWDMSQIVIPNDDQIPGNTTERYLHMIGDDSAAIDVSAGMIKAYAESRSRPQTFDPNTVGPSSNVGGILGEMFDVGSDDSDVVQNARTSNFATPYPTGYFTTTEWYPGGANQYDSIGHLECIMSIRNTAPAGAGGTVATTYSPGFLAGCGLLQISVSGLDGGICYFKLEVAAGDYKGVAARSMAVVN